MTVQAWNRFSVPMESLRAWTSAEALSRIFWHLFRITAAFALLFADSTILLGALLITRLRSRNYRRQAATFRDVHFYPKTVLITGIGAPHALALARAWAAEGHRVVGADVADLDIPIRSGGSMSNTLVAFYRVPKDHYISRILDIVQREKIDIWIPCSPKATAIEDGLARQVIESRTSCRCIAFERELTACFEDPVSFREYLTQKSLPVVESHQVQSRDSIHKILNRSPTKSYRMLRCRPGSSVNDVPVILPKRTPSKTYSEVSEIQISKDFPWILQQQARLGEFFADILFVRGHVHAIKVRLSEARLPHWGASRLDEAMATAIHRLMQAFAEKGGPQMTGHLSVRLLVDEEFDSSSVRHSIHIADCIPGAVAVETLLRDAESPISGYLTVLPSEASPISWKVTATLAPSPQSRPTIASREIIGRCISRFLSLGPVKRVGALVEKEFYPFLFWKDAQFSFSDPLPWWWHVHVYQPLREIWTLMKQVRGAGLAAGCHN
ncbi:hypothetical protein N7470_006234 [Penicillium chermesinum]|nr:hypothetical protein N7470_006234 [Penicillium chermesinum]